MVTAVLRAKSEWDGKERLRLWVRLLRVARAVEAQLRERLQAEFDTTLPRFDVMAALFRAPDGMTMSEVSRFLLVSNGNVTGIVDRLVSDGLVARANRDGDRRVSLVRLTPAGRAAFRKMASAHQRWVDELLEGVHVDEARLVAAKLQALQSRWESVR